MQKYNPFNLNIYTMLFNALRLAFLAFFSILFFFQINCYKKVDFEENNTETSQNSFENRININLASAEELEKLPKIGKELSQRIIEYRARNGKFQRVEHLILVRGMSDKKFREIKNLVKIE